ncbi:MAG: hypothetical protein WCC12_06185 [Anaerolineales bacterium]
MKKSFQIFVLGMFLAGCSNLSQLMATPTPPPPTETSTPFVSETPIPTQNLFATSTPTPLTFTPTVTSIGAELFTPTSTATDIPPTPGVPVVGPISDSYFTPMNVGFLAVLVSGNMIYYNEGPCMPRNIKFSAFVEDLINTDKVLLFMRLREKKNTLHLTDWGAGAIMVKNYENGSFNYNVQMFNIKGYRFFTDAWLEYQLVALTEDMEVIGRTQVYDRNITLKRCMPIP